VRGMPAAGPHTRRATPPHEPRISVRNARRLETWLWTGPVGHLAGGALDFAQALARYMRARACD
jgi:hypothetical protein